MVSAARSMLPVTLQSTSTFPPTRGFHSVREPLGILPVRRRRDFEIALTQTMDVVDLTAGLDSWDFMSAPDDETLSHLSQVVEAVVAAIHTERRQMTWSERNLLASALRAMEHRNWLLARAYIWNAIQLDGQGRRVFGDEHRARLSQLTPQRLLDALGHLCRMHRLPRTFGACSPPQVPHTRA